MRNAHQFKTLNVWPRNSSPITPRPMKLTNFFDIADCAGATRLGVGNVFGLSREFKSNAKGSRCNLFMSVSRTMLQWAFLVFGHNPILTLTSKYSYCLRPSKILSLSCRCCSLTKFSICSSCTGRAGCCDDSSAGAASSASSVFVAAAAWWPVSCSRGPAAAGMYSETSPRQRHPSIVCSQTCWARGQLTFFNGFLNHAWLTAVVRLMARCVVEVLLVRPVRWWLHLVRLRHDDEILGLKAALL